jgi:hypothetical protein
MYNNPNNESLTQHEKIFVVMLRDHMTKSGQYRLIKDNNEFWKASDFQHEHHGIFVGYEASARMSELAKKYPFAFELRQNGRFREMRFKFENAREIYNHLPVELGRHLVREKVIL